MKFTINKLIEFLDDTVYYRVKDMAIAEERQILNDCNSRGIESPNTYTIWNIFDNFYMNKLDGNDDVLFSRFVDLYKDKDIKLEDIKAGDFIKSLKEKRIWMNALDLYDGYYETEMYDFILDLVGKYMPKKIKAKEDIYTLHEDIFIECAMYSKSEIMECFSLTIKEGEILEYCEEEEIYYTQDGTECTIDYLDAESSNFEIIEG